MMKSVSTSILIFILSAGNRFMVNAFISHHHHQQQQFPSSKRLTTSTTLLSSIPDIQRQHGTSLLMGSIDSQKMAQDILSSPALTSSMNAKSYMKYTNDYRYAASDWFHNIKSLPKSTILRSIKGPVTAIAAWSLLVSVIYKILAIVAPTRVRYLTIPTSPHSLLVSALGLLLVFRTNSAYQRFAEGRVIWEHLLSISRNLTRLVSIYEDELGSARKRRIFRLLGVFPYLLHSHIQLDKPVERKSSGINISTVFSKWKTIGTKSSSPTQTHHNYEEEESEGNNPPMVIIDGNKLPWSLIPPKALQKCTESANPPLWICDRLAREIKDVPYAGDYSSRERFTFLDKIDKLSQCIGQCERIHQTAVPENYARHALRSLTIWLFSAPFALVKDLGLLTAPVMMVMAWLMFGVYQIGASIEDPFQGSLRLRVLCDDVFRDVAFFMGDQKDCVTHRDTAYQIMEDEINEWDTLDKPDTKIDGAVDGKPEFNGDDSHDVRGMKTVTSHDKVPDDGVVIEKGNDILDFILVPNSHARNYSNIGTNDSVMQP